MVSGRTIVKRKNDTGAIGEKIAGEFLQEQGYVIGETNYRCPYGEIDIIARQEDCLVFIEVRTKTNMKFGTPEESVTRVKKDRLRASAQHYLQAHNEEASMWRIDFVAVELGQRGELLRIELFENAVGE